MDRFDFRHKPSPELFDSLLELLKLSFPADEYRPCDLLKEMLNWPTFSIYAEHDGDHAKALMFSHDLGGTSAYSPNSAALVTAVTCSTPS